MKTAICYYSKHHGNTLKVLEAMAQGHDVELFDVTARMAFDPSQYDVIGFASGIYAGRYHETLVDFARRYLPEGQKVFLVHTSASGKGGPGKPMKTVLAEKKAEILGSFICQGMTTFGPFKLVHGFPKGLPGEKEFRQAREFYEKTVEQA